MSCSQIPRLRNTGVSLTGLMRGRGALRNKFCQTNTEVRMELLRSPLILLELGLEWDRIRDVNVSGLRRIRCFMGGFLVGVRHRIGVLCLIKIIYECGGY